MSNPPVPGCPLCVAPPDCVTRNDTWVYVQTYHHSVVCECNSCGAKFKQHWSMFPGPTFMIDWLTDEKRLLRGTAICCEESYDRPCPGCGGWQAHASQYRREAAEGVVEMTPFGPMPAMVMESFNLPGGGKPAIPRQPMFWRCRSCGRTDPDPRYPNSLEA